MPDRSGGQRPTLTLSLGDTRGHPAFAGHFPARPILPGVVLLDRAIAAIADHQGLDGASVRIASTKFLAPVAPDMELRTVFSVSAREASRAEGSASIAFEVFASSPSAASGGQRVATGVLTARPAMAPNAYGAFSPAPDL